LMKGPEGPFFLDHSHGYRTWKFPEGFFRGLGYRAWNDTSLLWGPSGEGSFGGVFSFPCNPEGFRPRTRVFRRASRSVFRSEDRRISSDAILLSRSEDRGKGICVPPFPPQGFSCFPSEEGVQEIFCGSLNASINAFSEEKAKVEAFPGWDPGYVGTCVPNAEACGGPNPFKGSRGNPSRKARSSTTPKGGLGWVLRIGTGARSNVRPKRESLTEVEHP
jgi:hypothetical protein